MPAAELGSGAVQILMGRMNDGRSPGVTLLRPVLTVRGSTAHAKEKTQ
jgi:DNA-binding LacI/PurR family transcriptional regulator